MNSELRIFVARSTNFCLSKSLKKKKKAHQKEYMLVMQNQKFKCQLSPNN
jgi:hypothetical protein